MADRTTSGIFLLLFGVFFFLIDSGLSLTVAAGSLRLLAVVMVFLGILFVLLGRKKYFHHTSHRKHLRLALLVLVGIIIAYLVVTVMVSFAAVSELLAQRDALVAGTRSAINFSLFATLLALPYWYMIASVAGIGVVLIFVTRTFQTTRGTRLLIIGVCVAVVTSALVANAAQTAAEEIVDENEAEWREKAWGNMTDNDLVAEVQAVLGHAAEIPARIGIWQLTMMLPYLFYALGLSIPLRRLLRGDFRTPEPLPPPGSAAPGRWPPAPHARLPRGGGYQHDRGGSMSMTWPDREAGSGTGPGTGTLPTFEPPQYRPQGSREPGPARDATGAARASSSEAVEDEAVATIDCFYCRQPIPGHAEECPYCGAFQ